MRSAPIRRATNPSASAELVSIQWASSTRQRSGCSSASGSQEAQRARVRQEQLPLAGLPQAERALEWSALLLRDVVQRAERGPHELHEAGEGERCLGLDADRAQDLEALRGLRRVVEQSRLPHSRLAGEHERAAVPLARVGQQRVDASPLRGAPLIEHRPILSPRLSPTRPVGFNLDDALDRRRSTASG